MSPGPVCSVVIPVFNRRDTLPRAIRSVFGQSVGDIEILVVDDGSDDGSADVAERLVPPPGVTLRVIRRDDCGGAASARNAAIDAATGTYVAFLDSDDEWLPTKLEVQIDQLRTRQRSLSLTGFLRYQGNTVRRGVPGVIHEDDPLTALLGSSGGPLTCSVMAFRREDARAEGLRFDERFPALEDLDFALSAARSGFSFVGVDDPLVQKYRDPGREHLFNPRTEVIGRRLLLEKYAGCFAESEVLERIQRRKLALALRQVQFAESDDSGAASRGVPPPTGEIETLLSASSRSKVNAAILRAYALYPRLGDVLLRAGANEDRSEELWRWMVRRTSEIWHDRRASRRPR